MRISKTLSSNDIGLTGGHQAGMVVPKKANILSFFPSLSVTDKNPRVLLEFVDNNDKVWKFAFIYYNNRLFGGTRNEYRLTRMTKYIKSNNLKVGDRILLTQRNDGSRTITHARQGLSTNLGKLRLSGTWKVIDI